VTVDMHERSGIGVQFREQSDKVVTEAMATEYLEQVFKKNAVKCMLKIKNEDIQRGCTFSA
jgi:predicted nucleotide-binding protein